MERVSATDLGVRQFYSKTFNGDMVQGGSQVQVYSCQPISTVLT